MQLIRSTETQKFEDNGFLSYEYPTSDPDINIARIEIHGRYPAVGSARNTAIKQIVYVESGQGTITIDDVRNEIGQDDVIFCDKDERMVWEGDLSLIISCTPAWTKGQYEILP